MPQIPFIEYVRPNGLKRDILQEVSPEAYHKGLAIRKAGLELSFERIPYGDISLCVTDTFIEHDLACRIVKAEHLRKGIEELLLDFDLDAYTIESGALSLLEPEDEETPYGR